MTNEIFLAKDLSGVLDTLSVEQRAKVVRTIDELGEDVLGNSYVIHQDDTPSGGLRAAHAGNLRILLRYVPDRHMIVISDLAPNLTPKSSPPPSKPLRRKST